MKEEISLKINRLNSRGWGVGTHGEKVVEVIGALPGDELSVRLFSKRRKKWRGDLLGVIKPATARVAPRCVHAGVCGGCAWQQMDYPAQLEEKERRVKASFADLIARDGTEFRKIIPCDDPWQYRNKMEFSFSQNKAGERFLGLMIAGSKGHVLNLQECHLVSPWFMAVLEKVRTWWEASGLSAYRMNDTGTLRTLVVREGKRTGDKLVMLTVSGNPAYAIPRKEIERFVDAVKSTADTERLSIFLRVQQACKGAPTQFFEMHLHGPDHLVEKLDGMAFKVSPTSFFQPNTLQAEKLYREALKLVRGKKKHVLDLYAGTATLGMALAQRAERVTAIEINPHACFDAEVNKELNQMRNVDIVCGDVGKKLGELNVEPDLVVIDPPRTGLDAAAIAHLKKLQPEEILYVACNHETQAANIQEMSEYRLAVLQPVDQFPHTPHIENIALLRRKLT